MLSVYLETSDTTRHVARRVDYTPCLLRITLKHWVLLLERFLDVDGFDVNAGRSELRRVLHRIESGRNIGHSAMKATEFEYRHQALVHRLIVGAAFLTYLVDREDVVWRFVKDSATPHELERRAFLLASLFIAAGAILCTWARACCRASSGVVRESYRCPCRRTYLGDLCYAIGLGSLAPLAGFVILVTEEALRVFRLMRRIGGPTRQDRLLLGRPLVLPVAEEIIRDGEARSGRRQSNGACWSQ
jgi:hypothetical protein